MGRTAEDAIEGLGWKVCTLALGLPRILTEDGQGLTSAGVGSFRMLR